MHTTSWMNCWHECDPLPISRARKSDIQLSGTSRFSFWASRFSFSLAQWATEQTSHLPCKVLKQQTETFPGQVKFDNYLHQGQAGIQVFSSLISLPFCVPPPQPPPTYLHPSALTPTPPPQPFPFLSPTQRPFLDSCYHLNFELQYLSFEYSKFDLNWLIKSKLIN